MMRLKMSKAREPRTCATSTRRTMVSGSAASTVPIIVRGLDGGPLPLAHVDAIPKGMEYGSYHRYGEKLSACAACCRAVVADFTRAGKNGGAA